MDLPVLLLFEERVFEGLLHPLKHLQIGLGLKLLAKIDNCPRLNDDFFGLQFLAELFLRQMLGDVVRGDFGLDVEGTLLGSLLDGRVKPQLGLFREEDQLGFTVNQTQRVVGIVASL